MKTRQLIVISILVFINFINADTSSMECTGKVTKTKLPLFIQAEQQEQNFRTALAQCQNNNNCITCPVFEQEAHNTLTCLAKLITHLENLEKSTDGTCKICEKNETNNLKERLMELLNTPEAQDFILLRFD